MLEREGEGEGEEEGEGRTPSVYSLRETGEEMKVVCWAMEFEREGMGMGMGSSKNNEKEKQKATKQTITVVDPVLPMQDPRETFVAVEEEQGALGLGVAVSYHSGEGKLKLWAYLRVDEEAEKVREQAGEEEERGKVVAKAKGKGKGKEREREREKEGGRSISMDNPPSSPVPRILSAGGTTTKRKRSSIAAPSSFTAGDRPRPPPHSHAHGHRRSSSSNSNSITLPSGSSIPLPSAPLSGGGAGGETDLLEALGESMSATALLMKRTSSALSAASSVAIDRRGSITRNELSITLDRMALGGMGLGMGSMMMGGVGNVSGEMDREATVLGGGFGFGPGGIEDELSDELESAKSEVVLCKCWEMEIGARTR